MEDVTGRERVLFASKWLGPVMLPEPVRALGDAIFALESAGLCPVLADGMSGGNAAMSLEGRLFVTPSGRLPGRLDPARLVEVVSFDPSTWTASYRSADPTIRPTSDTPLYDGILRSAAASWPEPPWVAVHGHALSEASDAARLGVPIGNEETEFSTPEDREALLELARRFPWPTHRVWIRRGHGFFAVGHSLEETVEHALGLLRGE